MSQRGSMLINVNGFQSQPQIRFVIKEVHGGDSLYKPSWLVGEDGNAEYASGVDLRIPHDITVQPGSLTTVGLGVCVRALMLYWKWKPPGAPQDPPAGILTAFWVVPSDSLTSATRDSLRVLQLCNSPNVIDAARQDGEISATFFNPSATPAVLKRGDAVVKIVGPFLQAAEYGVCLTGDDVDAQVFGTRLGSLFRARGGGSASAIAGGSCAEEAGGASAEVAGDASAEVAGDAVLPGDTPADVPI